MPALTRIAIAVAVLGSAALVALPGADAEVLCKGVTSARAEAAVCVVYHADPSRPLVALNAGAGADGVPTLNLHYHAPP